MQNRRDFIKKTVTGSMLALVPLSAMAFYGNSSTQLTILHTSDTHSHIDPLPLTHSRFPGRGGYANRAAIIKKVRAENENVVLLDSGDIFQGTPYYNYFGGNLELQLMSQMDYDASTLGNHEFDNGLQSLSVAMQKANFPFINTNYTFTDSALEGKTKPWLIIVKDNIRIGIIGFGIDPKGLIAPSNIKGVIYKDPSEIGDATALMLKKTHGCNLVIALSHMGLKMDHGRVDDMQIASQSKHIDIILGGHTHTFMTEPIIETNAAGKPVIIIHSGVNGVSMGRVDLFFEKKRIRMKSEQYEI
jgi:5'-nucleotidase